jgi:hypothetical protein
VNTVVTAFYDGDSVYIPVGTLFNLLHLDRTIVLADSTIKGFFITPNNQYEINFSRHVARLAENETRFDSTAAIVGKVDFYVLPSLLHKVFGLDFSVDLSSLSLLLTTEKELPVTTEYQRESRRNYLMTTPQGSLIQAPLVYPRQRSLLNGGVADYSLTGFSGAGESSYNYSLTGGGEILGGEAEGTVFGNVSGSNSELYSSDLSWRYVFDSSSYITSVGIGNLNSNGMTQYGFRGAQVSNEPATVRTMFSKYAIDARTNPNWDVELYLNGQLVGYSRADSAGNAHFTIPLIYGTSFIQLKYYGPSGEVIESDRRLQIPFNFLPAGQITYTVGSGWLNNTNESFLSADVLVGFTDWLTDKIGTDYVDSPLFSKPLLYNSVSMRMSSEYALSLDIAPSSYFRSTFSALYPSQAAIDLVYSRYQSNQLYNPSEKLQDAQADFFVPVSYLGSSFNMRGSVIGEEYIGGEKSLSYSAYLNSSAGPINASVGYLASMLYYGTGPALRSNGYTASVLYAMFFPKGALDFLNGALLSTTMKYGVLKNSLDDIRLDLSKNVHEYVRVAVAVEKDYVNKFFMFSLQAVADLPSLRSTSNFQEQNGRSWFTENVSGSVGYDRKYDHFVFNNLGWVGHSAASMRMFVDNNNDGVYDEGDEIIPNGTVTLRQAVSSEVSSGGITREWNLLPYTQYSADIDMASIRNPLLIPKMKSFSFFTDPNSYKPIDIPFFAGGIVDGTVTKLEFNSKTAIPGLTLYIKGVDSDFKKSISVFGDGSFYYMGIPPGKYEAYVDSSQLAMLEVVADPALLTFEVKATKNGDFVEGLEILLRDKKTRSTTPAPAAVPATPTASNLPEKPPVPVVKVPPTPPAPVPSKERYVIRISSFGARRTAEKFAATARKKTGEKLNVSLDDKSRLYVVQSDTIETMENAMEKLTLFLGKFQYRRSFMMDSSGKRILP